MELVFSFQVTDSGRLVGRWRTFTKNEVCVCACVCACVRACVRVCVWSLEFHVNNYY